MTIIKRSVVSSWNVGTPGIAERPPEIVPGCRIAIPFIAIAAACIAAIGIFNLIWLILFSNHKIVARASNELYVHLFAVRRYNRGIICPTSDDIYPDHFLIGSISGRCEQQEHRDQSQCHPQPFAPNFYLILINVLEVEKPFVIIFTEHASCFMNQFRKNS